MARSRGLDMSEILKTKGAPPPAAATPQRTLQGDDANERTIALTIKAPASLYTRLKLFGAQHQRTNQDIGLAALREYLDHHGG